MYLFDIVPAHRRKSYWKFRVLAVANSKNKNDSELAEFFNELEDSEIAGFLQLFERYCENGKANLTTKLFHQCDRNRKLYQFIKGDHRITCFIEDGNVVVCSHGFRKSTGATPRRDQDQTDSLRKEYQAAVAAGKCIFIDD